DPPDAQRQHRAPEPDEHQRGVAGAAARLQGQPRTVHPRPRVLAVLSVLFLGTSAARPTIERNVAGLVVTREGESLLFECGEGTQRQMMRYGASFGLSDVFFSHFHADHYLGLIGLVRTLGLQGRTDPMRFYGPKGAKRILGAALAMGTERGG